MAAEGLLAVDRRYSNERGGPAEVVSFPYQRFSDHLLLKAFLAGRIDQDASPGEVVSSFAAGQPLGEWLADAPAGAIEALAVQLPERWGVEILDVRPRPEAGDHRAQDRHHRIWDAFIASIVVRDRSAFTDRTVELINNALRRRRSSMIDALISVAPDPTHPFNAERQHRFLSNIPMAVRDASWGIPQYDDFGDPTTALDRLIRWAARGPYPSYPPDVIALAALTLSWVLGSSNRFARDYTTKAIASLYIGRVRELTTLIERFADVDDPYIKQRLAAAALGAVTRTGALNLGPDDVKAVVLCLTERLIEADGQLPDILLRDQSRRLPSGRAVVG